MPRRIEEHLARRGGALELLRAPAALYAGFQRARNALHDRGLLPAARLSASVVSVGNLTAGGTGKTPMVVWLARELERRGRRAGILSRGYGRAKGAAASDEGELLARLLPGVPHVQGADRIEGGLELERRGCDAILLDDGFQHRRLARELDLVLVDAMQPWGLAAPEGAPEGARPVRALLPRGLLREPPRGLARADAIVVSRADQVEGEALERLEEELAALAPGRPLVRAAHRPVRLVRQPGGSSAPPGDHGHGGHGGHGGCDASAPGDLAGRPVVLLSGIANPRAFERTARDLGADVRAVHRFPDHHRFTRAELEALGLGPGGGGGGGGARGEPELLVTAKDAVKLAALGVPCSVLEVEWQPLVGGQVLEALLDALPLPQALLERRALHEGLHG